MCKRAETTKVVDGKGKELGALRVEGGNDGLSMCPSALELGLFLCQMAGESGSRCRLLII